MAAVSWDDRQTSTVSSGSSTSFSLTTSGNNRAVVVFVLSRDSGGAKASGVTYNSVSMTKVDDQEFNVGSNTFLQMFVLHNAATGSNTVAVTYTGSTASSIVHAVALSNVDSSIYNDSTYDDGVGTTATSSGLTAGTGNDLQIACIGTKGVTNIGASSGWTEDIETDESTLTTASLQYDQGLTGSNDISCSISASSDWGAMTMNIVAKSEPSVMWWF